MYIVEGDPEDLEGEYGQEEEIDEEEFLRMMEQEAAAGRYRGQNENQED